MYAVCLLTLNAGPFIEQWAIAVHAQKQKPDRVLVIDSTSEDNTRDIARAAGFEVEQIPRSEFGHGRTRQYALERLANCEFVAYMTQDAILAAPDSLQRLLSAFDDPMVEVAYGRQLPHEGAGPIARHARAYNYPEVGEVRSLDGHPSPGLQVAFCSDSFAAYRVEPLMTNGGFPSHVMFGEDMYVAAKCLLRGGRVAYVANATAFHSHDYSIYEDFRRYFDTGAFHERERWLLERFGSPEGRGAQFVASELSYLRRVAPTRLPEACIRGLARYAGYRAGRLERLIPLLLKRKWSMTGQFGR